VADKFNCGSVEFRTPDQLRTKFENLKKETKKKSAEDRQQRLKTGGGPYVCPSPDTLLEKIASIAPLSIVGMLPATDSDVSFEAMGKGFN
jgi:hypothetical protein